MYQLRLVLQAFSLLPGALSENVLWLLSQSLPTQEHPSDIAEVINRVQFWYACLKHHGQQVNEQGCPPPENKLNIFT